MSGIRKERDPIDKLKRITMELGFADEAAIKTMEKEVCLCRVSSLLSVDGHLLIFMMKP